MELVSKLPGSVPESEQGGISMGPPPWWEISAPSDAVNFFRSLSLLLPLGSVLYFEGTIGSVVREYLEQRPSEHQVKVMVGTIWPRQDIHHIQFSRENIEELVQILETGAVPFPSTHFHAYREDTVLLWWHDAFDIDPMLISAEIEEKKVADFCTFTGCSYSLRKGLENDKSSQSGS